MKKILAILFAIVVLTACSSEENDYDYTFTGEGEHWKAEYSVSGTEIWGEKDGTMTYSNEQNRDEFVLTYKGSLEELSSLKYLKYSYETSVGGGSAGREFDQPPAEATFKKVGGKGNGAKVREDEVIQVTVKWNDHEESFELYQANKEK